MTLTPRSTDSLSRARKMRKRFKKISRTNYATLISRELSCVIFVSFLSVSRSLWPPRSPRVGSWWISFTFFSQLLFLFFMQWQIELRSHNSFDFTIPSSSSDFSSFHSVMTKSSWDCTFHGIHRQHSSTLSALLMLSVAVNEATGGAEGQLPEKSQVLKSHANSFVQLTASYFFLAYFPYKYIYFGLLASVLIWRHLRWLSTFEWRWNIHKISSIYRRSLPLKHTSGIE